MEKIKNSKEGDKRSFTVPYEPSLNTMMWMLKNNINYKQMAELQKKIEKK